MLGVILNSVVDAVRYMRGSDGVSQLVRIYGRDVKFQDFRDYPDVDLHGLVAAATTVTGKSTEEFQRELAPLLLNSLQRRFPNIAKRCTDAYSTLVGVEETHMSISPIANKKKVVLVGKDDAKKTLTLRYQSPNKLDVLFESFILEVAKRFNERVELEYLSRMSEGAESTVVRIKLM